MEHQYELRLKTGNILHTDSVKTATPNNAFLTQHRGYPGAGQLTCALHNHLAFSVLCTQETLALVLVKRW